MNKPPDSVQASVDRMMSAAQRLTDATARITPEELELLGECSSRIRLHSKGQVIPYPRPNEYGDKPVLDGRSRRAV